MNLSSNIRKIGFLALGMVVGAGLLVLLLAAISKKNHRTCTGVDISINGKAGALFLSRQDILNILVPDKNDPPPGKPLASFNLKKMEAALEQNIWVKEGQLFFDNNGVLRIAVEERTPVARIITVGGGSFYIDSSGKPLPLNTKLTVKLPVYSNFPADQEKLSGADSLLLQQIKDMSPFILNNPFWMAQIGQIDITPDHTFEMIPVIGKHLVVFGDGSDYEQKFHRLYLFYRQVSARVGLDRYSIINVAYDKQVVATKRGATGKIDSLQALKNIQKLIEASHRMAYDTVSTTVDNNIVASDAPVPTLTILKDNKRNAVVKDSFNSVPSSLHPLSLKSRAIRPLQTTGRPKAVMKKLSG